MINFAPHYTVHTGPPPMVGCNIEFKLFTLFCKKKICKILSPIKAGDYAQFNKILSSLNFLNLILFKSTSRF